MNLPLGKIAYLCFAWTVFILLGIALGLNLPFILAVIGTVLYLIG
jgi:hypothetical protein